jgi:hypothetical protein
MKRKKYLQKILDTSLKSKIVEYFGKGSYIKVLNLTYVRSKDCYTINVTIYVGDIESNFELIKDGGSLIVKQAWDVVGDKKPIMVNFSVDVPE